MDIRTQVINSILETLSDIDYELLQRIENSIYIELNKYEMQERCTNIIVHDNSNLGIIQKFIATKRLEGKSEKTINKYRPELENLVNFLNKNISEITSYDLRYYLAMYKEHRKISNRTLENMRKTISSFFGWLQSEGFITHNPSKAVKQIKYEKVVRKPFTPVERERIKNACNSIRDLALTEFLYSSGLRVSEVVSLDISNIDFMLKEATVIGKGGKERKFYLSDICMLYLKNYLESRTDRNPALFVSVRSSSERISKSGIEAMLKRLGERANVENVHPHRYRRTLASDLVKKGVPIQDIAEILGHSDLRTTQVYVCLDQESVKYHYNKAIA